MLIVFPFRTQGWGFVALGVTSGAAIVALHQRLHAMMLGARVVTAGGLLGAMTMLAAQ